MSSPVRSCGLGEEIQTAAAIKKALKPCSNTINRNSNATSQKAERWGGQGCSGTGAAGELLKYSAQFSDLPQQFHS